MFRCLMLQAILAALPIRVAAQTHVDTVADPGADPRHPTATVTHVDLSAGELEGNDTATIVDAVAGVRTRRTSFGQSAFATIRGSNSRQVLVEYEGLRLNPPFGAGFDLGGSTPGFDTVSIWRGAASTYRGGGAVAGALEFRTRHRRKAGTELKLRLLGGSHDTYSGTVSTAVASKNVSTRLALSARQSDGDFAFTDAQGTSAKRINNDHSRRAAFGATELRDGPNWLRATVIADAGERGTPGLSEFQSRFAQARLEDQQTSAILGVGSDELTRWGEWSLEAKLRGGAQLRKLEYRNPQPFLSGTAIVNETRSSMFGVVAEAAAWGPRAVGRIAIDGRYGDWHAAVEAARTTAGVGASWEQQLGERWLLVGALRGELDSDSRGAALPAIGVQWAQTRHLTWLTNVGRTFRAPNLDELYLDTESLRGNPDLEPEDAWVADAGFQLEDEQFRAAVTAFGRAVDREILFLPVTAYLVEAQNIQGTYAIGGEAEAVLRRRPFNLRAAYTFTHARLSETRDAVPLQPQHVANIRAEVMLLKRFHPWTAASLRGPMTLDTFGNSRTGTHLFWDAGLRTEAGPVAVGATVRNILDDDEALNATQQPMPGRTFWLSLALQWEAK